MQIIKRFTNGKFKKIGDHRVSHSKKFCDVTVTRTVVLPQFLNESTKVDYVEEKDGSLTVIVDCQMAVETVKKIIAKINQNGVLIDEAIEELKNMD